MFKIIINDVGYEKEFNEEFSRERLNEIIKEIGEYNKNIGGIEGEIIVSNGIKQHLLKFYTSYVQRLIHRTKKNIRLSFFLINWVIFNTGKVDNTRIRIVNKSGAERKYHYNIGQYLVYYESREWLGNNRVEFILEGVKGESITFVQQTKTDED